jgi:heme/copper-type cytochrome/quinol oxidase subunit 3
MFTLNNSRLFPSHLLNLRRARPNVTHCMLPTEVMVTEIMRTHPFLAHHFDDPEQQYDSGKLGIWLFLVTEVLFFSGMFCAYALYRSRNPRCLPFPASF